MYITSSAGSFFLDPAWLVPANLVLAGLLILWMLRYLVLDRKERDSKSHHRETIDALRDGFYRSTIDGRFIFANHAMVEMAGFETEADMCSRLANLGTDFYVDPNRRAQFLAAISLTGVVTDFTSEIRHYSSGETVWISENVRAVRDIQTGELRYFEGTVRDVSDRVRRRQLEIRLEKLANNLPGGLFQTIRRADGKFEIPYVSEGFRKLAGIEGSKARITPEMCQARVHPDDVGAYNKALLVSGTTLQTLSHEFRYCDDTGAWRWAHIIATPERIGSNETIWHGHMSDITSRKDAERKIEHLAYYDTLTNLPNRRMFTDRLALSLKSVARRGEHGAVLFIDIDNFKSLNDTQGHEVGDLLLRKVADRLSASIRANDTVSRFGGDEFVLLLDALPADPGSAIDSASAAATKILREFSSGFDLGHIQHHSTPSIGVVVFDGKSENASDIVKSADIAMYEAKKRGRNNFVVFNPDSLKDVSDNFQLQRELSGAIRRGELEFAFQPQVDINGKVLAAEALVRWRHPERGLLSPGVFVPMAEKTGMIMEINEWVLDQAIGTLAQWRENPALRETALAINVSVAQLRSREFAGAVRTRIAAAGIDGRLLTLELTEQVMLRDPQAVAARMHELKALGVRLSLDDFGTGYSSLSQLNAFPFDEVKIDGTFVSDIEKRESNRTLIEGILGMASALKMETVAEHVGSSFQLEFLAKRGCRRFQGYYCHAPLPQQAFIELLENQHLEAPALPGRRGPQLELVR